jgi:hypothetical protein
MNYETTKCLQRDYLAGTSYFPTATPSSTRSTVFTHSNPARSVHLDIPSTSCPTPTSDPYSPGPWYCSVRRTVPMSAPRLELTSPFLSPAVILTAEPKPTSSSPLFVVSLAQLAFCACKRSIRRKWPRTCCSPVRVVRAPCTPHVAHFFLRSIYQPTIHI